MTETSIAHYRIAEKIGQGGMGEVYRATDTKLKRDVAVKILPEVFANNPDRMARFGREAQVLASLNHANIASIYGLEEADGKRALVMELVEGDTLAERLKRGPIPLEEALNLAKQIAEALEEAHEHGFIHRDLKPDNVKVTPGGTVKLLDFGLAKALEGEAGGGSSPDLSQSPTFSAAATAAGMILGTAGYMSPEQARGQKVDRRADIWSFGVVLYEMLTGAKLYSGQTVSDVLAKVLEREPDWQAIPEATPAAARRLLRRCLEKSLRKRLQAMGDARLVIEECLEDPYAASMETISQERGRSRTAWQRILPWALVGLASALLAIRGMGLGRETPEPPLRLSVQIAEKPLFTLAGPAVALSPDGTRVVTIVGDQNARELQVRALDQFQGTVLVSGRINASSPYSPFVSPDGKWVGFVTPSELQKIPLSGGAPMTLCQIDRSRGASWGEDGVIVVAPSPNSGLARVPAAGGELQPLTTLDEDKGEATHRWPQVLPGGRAVLFTSHTQSAGGFESANLEVADIATGERKVVLFGGSFGRYVASGHLMYVRQGTLFAVPFDLGNLEVRGSAAPVAQNVGWDVANGTGQFTVSETGRLAYVSGNESLPEYPIVWVDEKGRTDPLWNERGSYGKPRLSPDGRRLSLTVLRDDNWDIWVYDLERAVSTRLTFEESAETEQVWSPDGRYLFFSSDRDGADNLYRKRADGSGEVERLTEARYSQYPTSVSSNGRFLAFLSSERAFDIWVLPLDGKSEPEPYLTTEFRESDPEFSPDGGWLAYTSNESGRIEVYVRPYPPGGGKWQVSDGGGGDPRWSGDGRRLYYRSDEGIMVASVETTGEAFRAGKPQTVFEGAFRGGTQGVGFAGNRFSDYDMTADGSRFVMFPAPEESLTATVSQIVLVTRWFEELERTFALAK